MVNRAQDLQQLKEAKENIKLPFLLYTSGPGKVPAAHRGWEVDEL